MITLKATKIRISPGQKGNLQPKPFDVRKDIRMEIAKMLHSSDGTIGRLQFLGTFVVLPILVFGLFWNIFDHFFPDGVKFGLLSIITILLALDIAYIQICAIIKRLRDIDKSPWFTLIMFVPGLNLILAYFLIFKE